LYYRTRNKLNKDLYLEGFFSNASSSSTAFIDTTGRGFFQKNFNMRTYIYLTQTPAIRIILAIAGGFLIAVGI